MKKLGVGIIGCGNISSAYLRLGPLFKALDMRAVADINMDAATAKAAEFGVRAESVEGLLTSDDIDVVVNLTIPEAHYPITKQILEAGKHAYTEKPIVLTLAEGEDLRRIATEKGLRIGSAPDTFLGGVHQQARAIIDEGKIGPVIGGTCHVMGHGMEAWHPNPDFFFQPGAGPVLDIGPYYITNLIQLLGPVKSVAALATTTFEQRTIGNGDRLGEKVDVNTPTNIHALLEFVNGATITLGASWDVWAHKHGHMELYGEEGSLFVPDPNFFGGTLEIGGQDKSITEVPGWDHPFGIANDDEGRANYRHRCGIDLAVHAVDVMTSILRAGEERRFVEMATTCDRPAALSPDEARDLLA